MQNKPNFERRDGLSRLLSFVRGQAWPCEGTNRPAADDAKQTQFAGTQMGAKHFSTKGLCKNRWMMPPWKQSQCASASLGGPAATEPVACEERSAAKCRRTRSAGRAELDVYVAAWDVYTCGLGKGFA